MVKIERLYWPDDVGGAWRHAMRHVRGIEPALRRCKRFRTAVQAGGNVGLWPRRMAECFHRVVTFEPEPSARECLALNVLSNVEVHEEALGAAFGTCAMAKRGLGSHRVIEGDTVRMMPLDALHLGDVDLLQFDLEGYEGLALRGAEATIRHSWPVIQLELRGFAAKYGQSTDEIRDWLRAFGYRRVCATGGADYVFAREP